MHDSVRITLACHDFVMSKMVRQNPVQTVTTPVCLVQKTNRMRDEMDRRGWWEEMGEGK